ncbi:hypothetical protein Vafri_21091 [Volvox africanus]|uniref:Plastocyanin-like domain-containing protein n=1 Tax=Volvox africanus TaxID=51714 RepID=A0A8J4BYB5_9CHLO|nr:hypothetical protein Vafri_21091 [Volvox africanus]
MTEGPMTVRTSAGPVPAHPSVTGRMSSPGIPWTKGEGLAGSSSSSDNGSSSSSDHGSSSSSDHGSSSSSDNGSSSGGSGTCGDRGHGRGNNVGAENVGDGYGCSSRYSGCNNFSRTTEKCTTGCAPTVPRVARTYFVAADKVIWKYAPSGRDRCTEPRSTAVQQLLPPRGMTTRLGGSFVKAQYRQYTDSSFQALLPRPPEWDHLGILGPPLYGAVGEVVRVVFRNHLPYAVNMVPTGGLLVDLENPSISCTPSSSSPPSSPSVGDARLRSSYKETEAADRGRTRRAFAPIPSNGTVSYLWTITAAAGPWVAATAAVRNAAVGLMGRATVAAAADVATATVTSRLWLYRSTVDPEAHDNAGLVGPMLVAADWAAGASGRAVDVDRDVVTLFTVMDERASPYASENAAALRQFQSAHYSVNGYIWCNGPRTNMQLDRDQEEQPTNTSSSHLRSSGGAGASDGDGGSGRSSGSDGGGGRSRGGDGGGTTGVADSMSRMLADGGGDGGDGSNGSSSRTPAALVTLRTGDRVRWHVASIGDVDGLHNFHWHGHTVEINGHHVDQFTSIPGVTTSANLRPEEPGVWMLHCHVNEHADGGMMALYAVEGSPPPPLPPGGVERVYYIAAEEVEWDFLPLGVDKCSSPPVPITATHPGVKYVEGPFPTAATISRMTHGSISMRDSNMTDRIRGVSSGDGGGTAGNSSGNGGNNGGVGPRLGHRLLKTVFVEYGDASFTFVKPRASEDAYLGLLGPILRAEVGDTMKVVFRNRARVSVTVHPHGLRYTKANEGSPYADGSTLQDKLDDRVAPGQAYNYTWLVPERSGPGPRDASSVMWLYHGHFKETADTNAGMVGAIIITAKGMARSADDPRPRDVERELVVLMAVFDEGASANFKANLQRVDPWVIYNASAIETLRRDSEFKRSLQKHSINGYMYCNMPSPPPFIMSTTTSSLATATATATAATSHADATSNDDAGDPRLDQVLPSVVRFYAAALGSTMDAHTAYLGGFPLRLRNGQQQQPDATDSVMISAGSMVTSDVMFTSPGDEGTLSWNAGSQTTSQRA